MAKVTITIEDVGNNVKTVCEPSFEVMMKMDRSGAGLTSAHGFAIAALRRMLEISKSNKPIPILIPRTGRA